MRILLCTIRYLPDFIGGTETRYHAMALAAARQGHEVSVLSTRAYTNYPDGPVDGIPVRRLDWPEGQDASGCWAAQHYEEQFRRRPAPELIWSSNAAMVQAAARAWPGTPILYSPGEMRPLGWRARLSRGWQRWREHGLAFSWIWWRREALVDQVARGPGIMAVPSRLVLDWITSGRPRAWPALRYIPYGVDVAHWTAAHRQRKAHHEGPLRVLVACQLRALKNLEHAIEAVARCPEGSVELRICGNGPHEPALRQLVRERAVTDAVAFRGCTNDMATEYAEADVFVMSSNCDLCPNTVFEALASGCPVIMRRPDPPRIVIGNYEMIADSPACLTYGTDDVDELAHHFTELTKNRERVWEMSLATQEWAKAHDWNKVIQHYFPAAL